MKIEISVIVPVYNVEKYLNKCVDSILNQSINKKIEIILVDDGSKDHSSDIIKEYQCRFPKQIRTIFQENKGQSSARNAALKIAQGEYVVFIDSDDYISPDYLEVLYKKAMDNDSDMVICDYTRVTDEGEFIKEYEANHIERGIRIPSYLSCNRIVRRCLFENYGINYKEGVICEDIPFILKLEAVAKKIETISLAGYYYRMNPKSTTSTFTKKKLQMKQLPFEAMRECVEFCSDNKHLIESEKLEFFICRIWTSLVLDLGRRCDKNVRKEMCEEVIKFMSEYFPECHKNKYVKLNYFSQLPKAHKWGTWIFVNALRYRLLKVLVFFCSVL